MMDWKSVYCDKKVFVTGHTGFKGSWLITWLNSMGAIVKGYALSPVTPGDLYNLINGDELCESVIGDIRNNEVLKSEILSFQPDFIFHLAAQPLVRLSYDQPLETFDTNVQGTANVLDALRFLPKPCIVVVITTDKVYQNLEQDYFYKEDDKLGGYDPYSASKAAAEIVVSSYRSSFFNPMKYVEHKKSVSSARAGNVIGGGDWAQDRIVPDIIRALSADQPVVVRNPSSVRPWEHVLEPLHGYLVLAAYQYTDPIKYATSFNFGPRMDEKWSVGDLVNKAIQVWGTGKFENNSFPNAVHEAGLLQLDISKAKAALSWSPAFSTEKAIELTIQWYYQYCKQKKNARTLIMEDINKLKHD